MKKIIFFTILIFIAMPIFSQPEHINNFIKLGIPKLTDYENFYYDTIASNNPIEWKLSEKYNTIEIPRRFLTRMSIMRTSAYLVIKDGEILHEQYWLNYNEKSLMNSFSIAKSVVSLLIGIAIDEGKIQSLNQKVKDFLPQFFIGLDSTLNIIDLLSMSSGLSWSEEFTNPMSDIVIAYYGTDLDSLIKQNYVAETPGNRWNYQCGNSIILGLIIEKATGMPLYKYAEEKLWNPIGATSVAYWGKDKPNGITKAFCCFYATPRDFAKLGMLVLNEGVYNGKQVVSKEYINIITQPANWLLHRKKIVDFYGLHVWITDYHRKPIPYFSGMLGQYVFIFPKQNAVVVRFGEMLNELTIMPLPPDVPLYLNVADRFIR